MVRKLVLFQHRIKCFVIIFISGFRLGKSTTGALYETTKFIHNELDNNQKVLAVFLDLAKAFDTMDHKKLINIFPGLEINNVSLEWFIRYLKKICFLSFLTDGFHKR